MKLDAVYANGFRNLKEIAMEPDERLNVIYGSNAQGKTNLLEAIWLCTGAKSFRQHKDYLALGAEYAEFGIRFTDRQRTQEIAFRTGKSLKDRLITRNEVKLRNLSELFGTFSAVIFTPEDMELARGVPEVRRNFTDLCVSQIKSSYAKTAAKYETLIAQRNALLKNIAVGAAKPEDLEIWDMQAARLGVYITVLRMAFIKKIGSFAGKLYHEISGGSEDLSLAYSSTVFDHAENCTEVTEEHVLEYLEALKQTQQEDIRLGFTTQGVHRDDILLKINGLSVRDFGSQGQKRSAALVLKLAQAYILTEENKDAPVILLDDVLSELDYKRQEFVLDKINTMQVFITCCDIGSGYFSKSCTVELSRQGKFFRMENGRLQQSTVKFGQ